jgi:hypothetical protein
VTPAAVIWDFGGVLVPWRPEAAPVGPCESETAALDVVGTETVSLLAIHVQNPARVASALDDLCLQALGDDQ